MADIGAALLAVEEELSRHERGAGVVGNEAQLTGFRHTLKSVQQRLESGNIPSKQHRYLGMGRVILDSWPFNNDLGRLILKAENAYRNLPD